MATETRLDATAELLDLHIAPAWRPGVCDFLQAAERMAVVFDAIELDNADCALAPVDRLPELSG